MNRLLGILLFITILLQGTVTSVPLALIVFLCIAILKRDRSVFAIGFFVGLCIDILALHPIGTSSLYITGITFLLFLYQRKYEINSFPFLLFSSFFGTFFYLVILGAEYALFKSLLASVVALFIFIILRIFMGGSGHTRKELVAPKGGIYFKN